MYVIPAKGEGYPIILGGPWLIVMNARQDWEKGTLVLKPPRKGDKPRGTIVYNLREGRQENLILETSKNEWSIEDSSSINEGSSSEESESDSLLNVLGAVLKESNLVGGESTKGVLKDDEMEKMLAKDFLDKEKEEFKVMLRKHSSLFIPEYCDITGVNVVEHYINLKPNCKPVAQKLRRLGVVQQEALLVDVKKLLQDDFIYLVENS